MFLGGNLDVAFEIPNNLNKFSFYPAFCIKVTYIFIFMGNDWVDGNVSICRMLS